MKRLKKVVCVLLAVVLVFAMGMTAMAADITISNSEKGHTYMAYQIFTGNLGGDNKTLSNIQWGTGVTDAGQTYLRGTVPLNLGETIADIDAGRFADTLMGQSAEKAKELATILVKNNYLQNSKGLSYADGKYTLTGLADGYYLITDTSSSGLVSAYMVSVAGTGVNIMPKTDLPTFEKKVKDVNDTSNATTDWQDSADYDIDDVIPFQLTATLPKTNYDQFETYYLAFEDNMCDGLKLDKTSIKVYHIASNGNETEINASNYKLSYSTKDSDDFKVAIYDVKEAVPTAEGNDKIVVRYSAQLTGNTVVFGEDGNPNTAYITYQRDPNYTGDIIPGGYGQDDKIDSDKDGVADPDSSGNKDTDGDGTPDSTDTDDDNDGILDSTDTDDDGDGIPDNEEDAEGDGTPDDEERDDDGDGIPNDSDTDDDNDGILDDADPDDDNDGIPDNEEDENGNGTPDVNEPDSDGDGTPDVWEEPSSADEVVDDTKKDTVIVFTYKLNVDKVDESSNPLAGAGFTLYKYDEDAAGAGLPGYPGYCKLKELTVDGSGTAFTYDGLDDGRYLLVETTTPSGYNTIAPIAFEVTAEHDVTADKPSLQSLEVTPDDSFSANRTTGQISTEVMNQTGTILPETGGIGTTIFYILGGILVAVAVVLLITKKRMENK